MSDDLIAEAWALLCAHDLAPAGAQPDDLATGPDARNRFCNLLSEALQDRTVFFDTECIYDEGDYADLVRRFADATHGEWEPADLQSSFHYPESPEEGRGDDNNPLVVSIEFTSWGRPFAFQFSYYLTDWVAPDLWEHIDAFAEEHLAGRYVQIPTDDQCYLGAYVPAAVAEKLDALIERLDREHPARSLT